jgi:hypothetical protein
MMPSKQLTLLMMPSKQLTLLMMPSKQLTLSPGSINLSTEFGALFVFSAFIETLDFFSLKKYVPRSPFHAECKAL